jgi:endonuclease/exonuclease/phosphatase family metal-dependent hydrolase
MNSVLHVLALVAFLSVATPFMAIAQERFRIMEYNVENLFDTIPEPLKDDGDFLPNGSHKWGAERYWAKQGRLARTIAAAGGDVPVELVGLVEVENDSVVEHLTRRTSLARLGYEYVITNSLDLRGIDVALLYQPSRFRPVHREDLRVTTTEGERPTRDVLFVEGLLPTLDTLSVFVAHFPSRRGGVLATEHHRCEVAGMIRHKVDSIQTNRSDALIVVMGDLNDEVQDASLKDTLKVLLPEEKILPSQLLYDLPPRCEEQTSVKGTYYYQGMWSKIDHIIVSGAALRSDAPLYAPNPYSRILAFPFLLERDEKSFQTYYRPKRTYKGPYYNGGISDHLPLLVEFRLR